LTLPKVLAGGRPCLPPHAPRPVFRAPRDESWPTLLKRFQPVSARGGRRTFFAAGVAGPKHKGDLKQKFHQMIARRHKTVDTAARRWFNKKMGLRTT
jgi:hypothetical protein